MSQVSIYSFQNSKSSSHLLWLTYKAALSHSHFQDHATGKNMHNLTALGNQADTLVSVFLCLKWLIQLVSVIWHQFCIPFLLECSRIVFLTVFLDSLIKARQEVWFQKG